jgi:S1-C subfamily serine protease
MYQLSARQILMIALLSSVFAAGTVALVYHFSYKVQQNSSASTEAQATPSGISDPSTVTDEQNNIEVYKAISPGVAFITTTSYRETFFGDIQEGQGNGSGSIIDAEGRILTNFHVIEEAVQSNGKLSVSLGEGKSYPAKYVGGDPDTDLAVIQVEAPKDKLTIVPFGDSDKLTVGQKVLAIGNPFGLDRTLTTGVISGLQRPIRARNGRPIEGAIQTDASINPGNSGGPLLDSRGRMIGINSQILTPAGGSVGVGFAVPISIAKRVVPQLIQYGKVRRPKLGIYPRDVEPLNRQFRMPIDYGVLILATQQGGPAANAGLKGTQQTQDGDLILGDIITAIDGEKVGNNDDLFRLLDKRQIGDTVKVEVLRNGSQRVTVPVRLTDVTDNQRRPVRRF